jgi:hypothetical protein
MNSRSGGAVSEWVGRTWRSVIRTVASFIDRRYLSALFNSTDSRACFLFSPSRGSPSLDLLNDSKCKCDCEACCDVPPASHLYDGEEEEDEGVSEVRF